MLVAFLIMLREGIEAALIVGIIAGYLKQTGREDALPAVWFGVVLALLLCTALGIALEIGGAEFPQKMQELFEGCVALLATAILASMVFWMAKAARSIKSQLHDSIDAATRPGRWPRLGSGGDGVSRRRPRGSGIGILSDRDRAAGRRHRRADRRRAWNSLRLRIRRRHCIAAASGSIWRHSSAGPACSSFLSRPACSPAPCSAFHEAGLWNALQQTAFDFSGILPATASSAPCWPESSAIRTRPRSAKSSSIWRSCCRPCSCSTCRDAFPPSPGPPEFFAACAKDIC